ncbi:MAG: phosphoribosylaminoimidazolesuccinocarboxamide synthase [Clostridiaceae bacterium]|jgi:phosphoribosylaminoimidazole-succinocarboxamide synthase|nr:phosphoribosylaminoimidazolesuccinocarboxamide synthase [Clostridiaceae bacterium]
MELIYQGKTKDVYRINSEEVQLRFKDDLTGKDGVFDPGANEIGLTIEGMGRTNLAVTDFFLNMLEAAGVKTHKIKTDLDQGTMNVMNCQPFGQGLEIIQRKYAVGSFIRRYGLYATEMMPLDNYVEITLKDDQRQDPLITKEALIALGILTEEQYEFLISQTKKITNLIAEYLAQQDLQLIDIKLEYGTNGSGEVVLIDEISAGNMRVYKNGNKLEPEELSQLILN